MRATVFLVALTAASAAFAQSQRTFVASTGNDANPCSRALPCRNFAAAVAAVQDGGEVVVLDSAGYGPVSIGKSVSLVAPQGVYAGVTAFTGDAIFVNAPLSALVVLRGLTLAGIGGSAGISVNSVGILHVTACTITRFSAAGLLFTSASDVVVEDTTVRENGSGIVIEGSGGNAFGTIDRCRVEENTSDGIAISANAFGTQVTVHETLAARNGNAGISDLDAEVDVQNCTLSANLYYGVIVGASGSVNVSGSMAAHSVYGFYNNGGVFSSYGNNQLAGNNAATFGTITPAPQQ